MSESIHPKLTRITVEGHEYLVPESVTGNPRARRLLVRAIKSSLEVYKRLLEAGVPEEDARYALITPFAKYLPLADKNES